ncbi:hypothetical protein LVB77_07705 [Lysobacter sp. 5GHs7-4]|uniref:hypothetical protein n=1 Tax=Lysobacter sp. 5GHs7-4 TaxID=2904253 RepID=UPI001E2FB549|nr:hypothetical protein [Lysobacter sp. 5GHs7-4]UHQ24559.1 hypothetical protein LVB77_07705 [Lysobacter sp. 5GHs7-4]
MTQAAQAAPASSTALKLGAWLATACLAVPLLSAGLYHYWQQSTGAGDAYAMVAMWFLLGTLAIEVPLLLITVVVLVVGTAKHVRSRRIAKLASGSAS